MRSRQFERTAAIFILFLLVGSMIPNAFAAKTCPTVLNDNQMDTLMGKMRERYPGQSDEALMRALMGVGRPVLNAQHTAVRE